MRAMPCTPEAYDLLHRGILALSDVEANGMRVDVGYLEGARAEVRGMIKETKEELRESAEYKVWRRLYGQKTNLGSRPQMARVLFDEMGHESQGATETGAYKMDEASLERLRLPFVEKYLELTKMEKLAGTYIDGVLKHVQGDLLHPTFNLHTTVTFRSSSNSPNFQNFPVRDKTVAKIIRRAFISREGHQLSEIDYSGAEVRVAACYHKDPAMVRYIHDKTTDMHRDAGMDVYKLTKAQMTGKIRKVVKGMFVFAQFYGSWWLQCAKDLWEVIDREGLTLADGTCLKAHLRANGIKGLGNGNSKNPQPASFEAHLKAVEKTFWKTRFKVYHKWRLDWFEAYKERMYFDTLTGFRLGGVMNFKDAINYPVQGSSFHCLLWALTKLNKALRKRRMRTVIVGQIHDSIVADVATDEKAEYFALAKEIMTDDVMAHYPWLIVPMEVEAELCPVGGSWYDKESIDI